jgi:hypothetical protein
MEDEVPERRGHAVVAIIQMVMRDVPQFCGI